MVFGAVTPQTMSPAPKKARMVSHKTRQRQTVVTLLKKPAFLGLERNSPHGFQSIKIVGCSSHEGGMVIGRPRARLTQHERGIRYLTHGPRSQVDSVWSRKALMMGIAYKALRTILRDFLIRGSLSIRKLRPLVYDVLVARERGS